MITDNNQFVKFSMAESEGHDPYPAKRDVLLIGHTPTLWDSLSSHNLIIALCHKKTTHKGVVEPISRIKLPEQLAYTVSFRSDLYIL